MRANGWMIVTTAVLITPDVSAQPDFTQVPGVVVAHSPASSGVFIGSPSLAQLPGGGLVASYDLFGPDSGMDDSGQTRVCRSADRGRTWEQVAQIDGQFHSTLFVHRGDLYLLGTNRVSGNVVIRRSSDGGASWTTPRGPDTGLLHEGVGFRAAPTPVVEHGGRLWRAMERRVPPTEKAPNFACVLSAPVDADLLRAASWTFSNFLEGRRQWLDGNFHMWREGNIVVGPEGRVVELIRVNTNVTAYPEQAARIGVSPDGSQISFDPARDFIDLPGGSKKFTIRYDPVGKCYWTLSNVVPVAERNRTIPDRIRNTLALVRSEDLVQWTVRGTLLRHRDRSKHAFQYADWQFDGDDIIAVCRTAYDDGLGGAKSAHDSNFLTFHRVESFRAIDDPLQ